MNAPIVKFHIYDFCFPTLDTLVQVEEADGMVVIRASRDTFSEQRKACFIRELAAEGFIPDGFCWFSFAAAESFRGVKWLVDISWLKLDPRFIARTRRFMLRLLGAAILLWLLLIGLLLASHAT